MILLDLNLPRKSGLEVLAIIKEDSDLRSIPVLVLTNSNSPQDIAKSYQLHANGYIHKPVELERFFAVMREIEHFWGTVVSLRTE